MGVTVVSQYRHIFPTDITFMLPPLLNSAEAVRSIVGIYAIDGESATDNFSIQPMWLSNEYNLEVVSGAEASQEGFRPIMCDQTNPVESKAEYCFGYAFTQRDEFKSLSSSGIYVCPFALVDLHQEYGFENTGKCVLIEHSYIDLPYTPVFDVSAQVISGKFILAREVKQRLKPTNYLPYEVWSYSLIATYTAGNINNNSEGLFCLAPTHKVAPKTVSDLSDLLSAYSLIGDFNTEVTCEVASYEVPNFADITITALENCVNLDGIAVTPISDTTVLMHGDYDSDYIRDNVLFDQTTCFHAVDLDGQWAYSYSIEKADLCARTNGYEYNYPNSHYVFHLDCSNKLSGDCDTTLPEYEDISGEAVLAAEAQGHVILYSGSASFELPEVKTSYYSQNDWSVSTSTTCAIALKYSYSAARSFVQPKTFEDARVNNIVHKKFKMTSTYLYNEPPLDDTAIAVLEAKLENFESGMLLTWFDVEGVSVHTEKCGGLMEGFDITGSASNVNVMSSYVFICCIPKLPDIIVDNKFTQPCSTSSIESSFETGFECIAA